MMRYRDENTVARIATPKRDADIARENLDHVPQLNLPNKRTDCSVCIMECCWGGLPQEGIRSNLARCSKCGIVAHTTVPKVKNKIHDMDFVKGLTCFQITHTREGYGIWQQNGIGRRVCYATHNSHPICRELKALYPDKPTNKNKMKSRKRTVEEAIEEFYDNGMAKLPKFDIDMDDVNQRVSLGKIRN
jgi:hypothetical protein